MNRSPGLLPADDVARLRDALASADFTAAGIAARIGPAAVAGVRRNDFRGLLAATAAVPTTGAAVQGDDRLAGLIRLFLGGQSLPVQQARTALAPLDLAVAARAGLVVSVDGVIRAGVDLDVYPGPNGQDWWILADLDAGQTGLPLGTDHVLGIGNAATTLANATLRHRIEAALDLGTGCGVQALHLSTHANSVTATDISQRALAFAATNADLNGQQWSLRQGDLLEPVAGQRFDLVVSNPPFVVGPGSTHYTYRDSGRPGDGICAELAAAAPRLLTEGGHLQFLANWLHVKGEDWRERVGGWVANTGCDAWIVQRETSDPLDYVRLWMQDASEPASSARAAAWLDWFDSFQIEAVGFGLVTIRRSDAEDPVVRAQSLTQTVAGPMGEQVSQWFARQDWLSANRGAKLLQARLCRPADLRLHQEASHDGDDWQVDRQIVTRDGGLAWRVELDPIGVAVVGGADGKSRLLDQLELLAAAYDAPVAHLIPQTIELVANLVERGLLEPVAD